MSADNWRDCPKCIAEAESARQSKIDAVRKQYGKIDADEFVAKLAEVEAAEVPDEVCETLREDYELLIQDNGKFWMTYRGECQSCGTLFTFKHECKTDFCKN